jgi:hypothetical protein
MWPLSVTVVTAAFSAIGLIAGSVWLVMTVGGISLDREPDAMTATDLLPAAIAVLSPVAALVAAVFVYRRAKMALAESHRADDEQCQKRFVDAANLLGNDNPTVRVAGVIAMATLARDWDDERQRCVDVLCGYLRVPPKNWPWDRAMNSIPPPVPLRGENEVRNTLVAELTKLLKDKTVISAAPIWLNLRGAVFGNAAYFSGATFTGNATFAGAAFTGDADFRGAAFTGDATFTGATFAGYAAFPRASFSGEAHFPDAGFTGDAHFQGATFSGVANFEDATFTSHADFRGASFMDVANFERAIFTSVAKFRGATFSSDGYFESASFSRDAEFRDVSFAGDAYFSQAEFTSDAEFRGATFAGEAGFEGATFIRDHDREVTPFTNNANFRDTVFMGDANFRDAVFMGDADFRGATFTATLPPSGASSRRSPLGPLQARSSLPNPSGFTVDANGKIVGDAEWVRGEVEKPETTE